MDDVIRCRCAMRMKPLIFATLFFSALVFSPFGLAEAVDAMEEPSPVRMTWGGRVRAQGAVSWLMDDTVFESVVDGPLLDGSIDFRLTNQLLFPWFDVEIHYEAILSGGETRKAIQSLVAGYPDLIQGALPPTAPVSDAHRLMDLTQLVWEETETVGYHRFDRLAVIIHRDWATVTLGRQALTWGNGFLFNPMDLFNPFAPTDIDRDYKLGDDMAHVQFSAAFLDNVQLLYVPRRRTDTGDVSWRRSSLAAKAHLVLGATELDILAAAHYDDRVLGMGMAGYWGGAAWRLDATWIDISESDQRDQAVSLVANIDYSWTWAGKNAYGFIELYFNEFGSSNYSRTLSDTDMLDRVGRGDLFVLGRAYLAGNLMVEFHPLFQGFATVIGNLKDSSCIVQPRAMWDIRENLQLILGATIYIGETGSEFGGIRLPDSNITLRNPDRAYIWITYYF